MKRILIMIILSLSMIFMTSCSIDDGPVADRITAPQNNSSPITGKWVVLSNAKGDEKDKVGVKEDIHLNKEILFHKDGVLVGDEYSTTPSFKVKSVDAYDYLLYKYKIAPKSIGIEDDTITVITILNENQYFYEFIRYGDEELLMSIEDNFYKLSKIVDEVSIDEINRYIDVEKSTIRALNIQEADELKSGILLGLNIPSYDEGNKLIDWEYKTIWINSQNQQIVGVFELDDLLVPRKNGFWMVDVNRETNGLIKDRILATPLFKLSDTVSVLEEDQKMMVSSRFAGEGVSESAAILSNILFVGNDYISIEKIDRIGAEKKTLEVYAMDNIDEKRPINLSDLIGEDGKKIFTDGAQSAISIGSNVVLNEQNVGLVRRSGYWTLKGRINFKQNDEELYKDFSIKAIPPKEMINYDAHVIPWNALKMAIPEALDAFSSPNNEMIIVVTHSNLLVYYVEDGNISNSPAAKIKLPENATIIMSEWAIGRYSNIWQNEVIKNNGMEIEY